jgi:hypothetical protein
VLASRSTAQQTATTAVGLELGSDDGLDRHDRLRRDAAARGGHHDDCFSSRTAAQRAIAKATWQSSRSGLATAPVVSVVIADRRRRSRPVPGLGQLCRHRARLRPRLLIYSMSVSVDGFIADREGAFGWTAPSEEQFRFQGRPRWFRLFPNINVMTTPIGARREDQPTDDGLDVQVEDGTLGRCRGVGDYGVDSRLGGPARTHGPEARTSSVGGRENLCSERCCCYRT